MKVYKQPLQSQSQQRVHLGHQSCVSQLGAASTGVFLKVGHHSALLHSCPALKPTQASVGEGRYPSSSGISRMAACL